MFVYKRKVFWPQAKGWIKFRKNSWSLIGCKNERYWNSSRKMFLYLLFNTVQFTTVAVSHSRTTTNYTMYMHISFVIIIYFSVCLNCWLNRSRNLTLKCNINFNFLCNRNWLLLITTISNNSHSKMCKCTKSELETFQVINHRWLVCLRYLIPLVRRTYSYQYSSTF